MLNQSMKRVSILGLAGLASAAGMAPAAEAPPPMMMSAASCPGDSGGITLSHGFCATVFADNIGHARHLVVAPNGVVYVNTWSGRYYKNDTPPAGGFLVALQDTKGAGKADVIERFGDSAAQGSAGGTGIQLYNGSIYAEVNDKIVKYPAAAGRQHRSERQAGSRRVGYAVDRRSPDASLHHRLEGQPLRRHGFGDERLRSPESPAKITRQHTLHGKGHPRRDLEVRRQQDRPEVLPQGALCHRHS